MKYNAMKSYATLVSLCANMMWEFLKLSSANLEKQLFCTYDFTLGDVLVAIIWANMNGSVAELL